MRGKIGFWEHFDRVYIISLRERLDRRKRISREVTGAGGRIDGSRIRFFDAIKTASADGFPSIGLHGCFLSHQTVLRDAIDARAARILVLEDDIVFHPKIQDLGVRALSALENIPKWRIANFGWEAKVGRSGQGWEGSPSEIIGSHCYAVNGHCLTELHEWFVSSYERPCGHPLGSRISPDGTLNHYREHVQGRGCFVHHPKLAVQFASPSDISPRSGWRESVMTSPVVRSLRYWTRRMHWK